MATTIPQKLYATQVNGLPSISLMGDISMDPNAAYLQTQFQEIKSPDQLRSMAQMAQNYYSGMAQAKRAGGWQEADIARSFYGPNSYYGQDLSTMDGAALLKALQSGGYFSGDYNTALAAMGGQGGASGYSILSPEEQKQMGFGSSYVQTKSIGEAQQYQADIASGKLVQIGKSPTGVPLYAPKGSPAAAQAQGQTPTSQQPVKLNIPQQSPQDVLTSGATKAGVMASIPQTNLSKGMSGAEVSALQKMLMEKGYDIPSISSGKAQYGYFGNETQTALTKMQEDLSKGSQALASARSNFGNYGPLTRDALSKITTEINTSASNSPDAGTALANANASLEASGMPTVQFNTQNMSPDGVAGAVASMLNIMNGDRERLLAAQKELSNAISGFKGAQITVEGKTIPMTLIGRQLDALKRTAQVTLEPLQGQVENLTNQLGMDKDMISTALAYGSYLKNIQDEPKYVDLNDRVAIMKNVNGKMVEVGSLAKGATPGAGGKNVYGGILSTLPLSIQGKVINMAQNFSSSDVVKRYNSMTENINAVLAIDPSSKNPSDHQAMIYALAKGLDPDSAVKEGEYDTIKTYAQSLINRYGKEIQNALDGTGFLSRSAIENIQKTMSSIYEQRTSVYKNYYSEQSRIIDNVAGLPVSGELLTDYSSGYTGGKISEDSAKKENDALLNQPANSPPTPPTTPPQVPEQPHEPSFWSKILSKFGL